jgi:phosphoribosylamine--glycine ligase
MAAKGYPGEYSKGSRIEALPKDAADLKVFHAGTRRDANGLAAIGGRVLNVTALGPGVAAAKLRAEAGIAGVNWPEGFYRHDIGWRAISAERNARLDR